MGHLVSSSPILTSKEYKDRRGNIGQYIYWKIRQYYTAPPAEKWYEHYFEPVTEDHLVNILWDFSIHTDRYIKDNRPQNSDKNYRKCILIEMTMTSDKHISVKVYDKINKYNDF